MAIKFVQSLFDDDDYVTLDVPLLTFTNTLFFLVYVEEPESVVRGSLQVSCQDDTMIVSLPYSATRRLSAGGGLAGMTLSDTSCAGRKNGSHWVILAPLSRCGFMPSASHLSRANRPGSTTFTNNVSMKLNNMSQLLCVLLFSTYIIRSMN